MRRTKRAQRVRAPVERSARAAEVERAEALIAEVDALPGPEHVKRDGDDDVQVALEKVANGGTVETPPAEAVEGGTGEPDAA